MDIYANMEGSFRQQGGFQDLQPNGNSGPAAWDQQQQQQLHHQLPSHQTHPSAAAAAAAAYSSIANWLMANASWQQQQHQHHQEFHQHELHPQHHQAAPVSAADHLRSALIEEPAADELAAEEAKWRQLPPSLRRRAGAQAATALLKAWMRTHADNPYPSKREKSALASLTNMSFAQISTWFANARRRLKKDSTPAAPSVVGAGTADESQVGPAAPSVVASGSGKPRIWSLVETALDTKEASTVSADDAARRTEGLAKDQEIRASEAAANIAVTKPGFNPIVTPEDICCWQMCQHYVNALQS